MLLLITFSFILAELFEIVLCFFYPTKIKRLVYLFSVQLTFKFFYSGEKVIMQSPRSPVHGLRAKFESFTLRKNRDLNMSEAAILSELDIMTDNTRNRLDDRAFHRNLQAALLKAVCLLRGNRETNNN